MHNFKPVDFVRAYCYKILPLVYDDSLSYYEVLCKVKKALNEVIENVNNLPAYIEQLIKEYITSGAIDEIIRELLGAYMLNVKYPPNGITPAVGDGTADDTEAIQGCIDYAQANGYGAVYFPSGKYLSQPITLKSNVGLYGNDRYSTSIICRGGASKALLSGNIHDVTIANLTLDGNDGFQVNEINCMEVTAKDLLLVNLICVDSSTHMVITGNGGHLQMDNIIYKFCVFNGLTISGNINVQASHLLFTEINVTRSRNVINIGTSNGTFDFTSNATAPVGMLITGNNNDVKAIINGAAKTFTDTGSNNNINIISKSISEKITGDKTVYTVNSLENVTGNKTIIAGDISETANNIIINVAQDMETDVKNNINFISKDLILNPTNPLTYRTPKKLNDYFEYIPAKDYEQNGYNILVATDNVLNLKKPAHAAPLPLHRLFRLLTDNRSGNYISQGMTYFNNNFYVAFRNSDNNTANIIKTDNNGNIVKDTNMFHGGHYNSLTNDGTYVYAAISSFGKSNSNYIAKFNADLVEVSYKPVNSVNKILAVAYDKITKQLWATDTGDNFYQISESDNNYTILKTVPVNHNMYTRQSFCVNNNIAYFINSAPTTLFEINLTNGKVTNIYTPDIIADWQYTYKEAEDVEFINGNFYMSSYSRYPTWAGVSFTQIFEMGFEHSVEMGVQPFSNTLSRYTIYVDGSIYTPNPSGSVDNKFYNVNEAIYSAQILSNYCHNGIRISCRQTENKYNLGIAIHGCTNLIIEGTSAFKAACLYVLNSSNIKITNLDIDAAKYLNSDPPNYINIENSSVILDDVGIINAEGVNKEQLAVIHNSTVSRYKTPTGEGYISPTNYSKNFCLVSNSTYNSSLERDFTPSLQLINTSYGCYLFNTRTNFTKSFTAPILPSVAYGCTYDNWNIFDYIVFVINLNTYTCFIERNGSFNIGEDVINYTINDDNILITTESEKTFDLYKILLRP